jgi:hypothetical protein
LSKKTRVVFTNFFAENISKLITLTPGHPVPAPQDRGQADPDLHVDRVDLPILPRLEVDPHHVRGHLQRGDPGADLTCDFLHGVNDIVLFFVSPDTLRNKNSKEF